MTTVEQLDKWVNGESVHNDERDECCPDFSCCNKNVDTPREVRERFQKADSEGDTETIMLMLGMFLKGAIDTIPSKPKAYISGEFTNPTTPPQGD